MVLEIVDSLEKIEQFLTVFDKMIKDGLVTLEGYESFNTKSD